MKKTKVVCSIGPASTEVSIMQKMVEAGMDVARINFSHATYEDNQKVLESIKEVRKRTGKDIAILYDTKGPDFRCGMMQEGGVPLIVGNTIRIVKEEVVGNSQRFSVNHKEALDKIQVGNTVLLEDALMKLEVVSMEMDGITCVVKDGGVLNSKKSINVPGVDLSLPFMSPVDREDIIYACEHEGDFLALSFVESKENILEVRRLLQEHHREDMKIISKVESNRAIENLDDIIEYSDGVMVARGDLGVEVPLSSLPLLQKSMIRKCREKEKFVIVATEMLASMYQNPRPTRAEVTDISNAVLDGSDAVMLSGETTVGNHPVEAVEYMSKICEEAEHYPEYSCHVPIPRKKDVTTAIADAVLACSRELDVKAIVVPTTKGHSAMVMSNLRPDPIILAICPSREVSRSLALCYGVYPKVMDMDENDMDEVVKHSKEVAQKTLSLEKSDRVIITGGIHENSEMKQTNFLKIEEI